MTLKSGTVHEFRVSEDGKSVKRVPDGLVWYRDWESGPHQEFVPVFQRKPGRGYSRVEHHLEAPHWRGLTLIS